MIILENKFRKIDPTRKASKNVKVFKYLYKLNIEDKWYFLNLMTKAIIELDTDSLLDYYKNASSEERNFLFNNYFLINQEEDSKCLFDSFFEKTRAKARGSDSYITKATIFTTTDCNARCFYCFEKDCERSPMTEEMAEKVVQLITKKYLPDLQLKISWFGGEPLYNIEIIDYISKRLKENNVIFKSSMISNGYLFTDEVSKRVKEDWGLTNIQITLDGTEEIYNRIKSYIYKETNAFETVLKNIDDAINNGVTVQVRLNAHKGNIDDLDKLVEMFHEKYNKDYLKTVKGKFSMNMHLLYQIEQTKDSISDELKEKFISLLKKITKYWKRPKSIRRLGMSPTCGTSNKSNVMFLPNGEMFGCEHITESEAYGHIDENVTKSEEYLNYWLETTILSEDCENCKFLPTCIFNKNCPGRMHYCNQIYRAEKNMAAKYLIKQAIKKYNKKNRVEQ